MFAMGSPNRPARQRAAHQRIRRLDAADGITVSAYPRFEKYMSQHYKWRLSCEAFECEEYRVDPIAARAEIALVWFEVSCEPRLF